jgi:hypothetical protein
MITYKIYPLPGINDKTLTGSFEAGCFRTLGELIGAIEGRDGVDLTADVPFMALLDGKPVDLLEAGEKVLTDDSKLFILPHIMGG